MKKIESLENVYSREINMRKSLANEPKEIRESVDKKLKSILESIGIEAKKDSSWSSPQKVVHLLVWEINPIRNMKGGLKWLKKDTNPKKS